MSSPLIDGSTGRVVWHVTMSLDGFVAGPDHDMSWLALDWLPRRAGMPALAERVLGSLGVILGGRRWYEASRHLNGVEGIYGGRFDGRVLVLTHHPDETPYDPRITFVSDGIESAVAAALAAAHGRDVVLFGADLARQGLAAGLVDEIVVHTAPVLLGAGVRLEVSERVELEPLYLGRTGPLADLHYRVRTTRESHRIRHRRGRQVLEHMGGRRVDLQPVEGFGRADPVTGQAGSLCPRKS